LLSPTCRRPRNRPLGSGAGGADEDEEDEVVVLEAAEEEEEAAEEAEEEDEAEGGCSDESDKPITDWSFRNATTIFWMLVFGRTSFCHHG
jgi:hypothetical protein